MRCACCEPEMDPLPLHAAPVDASALAVRAMPRILQRMTTRMAKWSSARIRTSPSTAAFTISAPGKAGERGDLVDEIHRSWDRERLEASHGYIQWLFPIFAGDSMNWRASPLSYAGAAKIREDRVMSERVRRSYVLFLDFIGFRLADAWTGRVEGRHRLRGADGAARRAPAQLQAHLADIGLARSPRLSAVQGAAPRRAREGDQAGHAAHGGGGARPPLAALGARRGLGGVRTDARARRGPRRRRVRAVAVSLEDAMPHDVRDELVGGVRAAAATTPARVASDAPSWRLAELKKRRS